MSVSDPSELKIRVGHDPTSEGTYLACVRNPTSQEVRFLRASIESMFKTGELKPSWYDLGPYKALAFELGSLADKFSSRELRDHRHICRQLEQEFTCRWNAAKANGA